ncbi:MAG: DUF3426 domain-containing protein [Deltaproteobacteria bacterium]|nr:MAG: DUF3426 domain-containing protein [Deltaproteobacteria bacterium]
MIIQCDACQTRFRLPDEKLKPGGVKVRCTKCSQVFRVEAPPAEPEPAPVKPEAVQPREPAAPPAETSRPEAVQEETSPAAEEESGDFDFDEFNMESFDQEEPADREQAPNLDLDGELPDLDLPEDFSFDEPGTGAGESSAADENGGEDLLADFSPDDLLGEDERLDTLVAEPGEQAQSNQDDSGYWDAAAIEPGEPNIGGDLGETYEMEDGSDDQQDLPEVNFPDPAEIDADLFGEQDSAAGLEDTPSLELDAGAPSGTGTVEEDFVFEEASDDLDESGPLPDLPDRDIPPAPSTPPAPSSRSDAAKGTDMPPRPRRRSSTNTRRRKKRKSRALPLFFLLLLTLAGGYYWLAERQGTWDPVVLARYLQGLVENKPSVDPTVNIELGNLKGMFVTNQSAGQLFAISGQATNRYQHPRSTVTVRGVIYDRKGQAVLQQTVFCGNPLDEAALRTLPWSKIEESMNNQFGEALSNLDIAPGKAVPFTIVFKNLPGEVAEFNVVVVDSRPGSQ